MKIFVVVKETPCEDSYYSATDTEYIKAYKDEEKAYEFCREHNAKEIYAKYDVEELELED